MNQQQLFKTAQELIQIKSIKYDGAASEAYCPTPGAPFGRGIADALQYVLKLCASFGMRTKNCNGYAGYAEVGEGEEMLGILVHLDVVPEGNGWTYPPYGGQIHDGKLYGRGAIDDKGPAAAVIFAVKSLMDAGFSFKKRVRLIFGLDEECDWEDMDYYTAYEEHPAFGFTPDADFPLIYGEKGILQLDFVLKDPDLGNIVITGGTAANAVADHCEARICSKEKVLYETSAQGTAAHASTPEEGCNAISEVMEHLYERKNSQPLCLSKGLERFIDFYHHKIGFSLHGEQMGCDCGDSETGRLTFNVGKIRTQQGELRLSVDLRCPATLSDTSIVNILQQNALDYGLEIQQVDFMKPVFSDCSSPLVKTLLEVYQEETGDTTQPMTMGGGTYARAMDHIVAFGPLFPGQKATEHMENEYISLEHLTAITRIYAHAIRRLCSL